MVPSDAIVIARAKEISWSRWHKHTRWLGTTKIKGEQKSKIAKEVELDGHGETTCGHELYLHELASVGSTMVIL